ncbi:MAG: hypothetical protein M1132_03135 [Chloroflexi bacterium]|nr:hypothetical protein [Chloroflexota bacterium]
MGQPLDPSPRLMQGSRIAVIGGGPAGSFFALCAQDLAVRAGLALEITIFERKDLTAAGPKGCNMCAGILSRRVIQGLDKLGIDLPSSVVLGRVRVYKLHWRKSSVPIEPPDASRQVLSVYRAGGPRKSPFRPTDGLDSFLLDQAVARGARVVRERVQEIVFEPRPRICTSGRQEIFDLAVLAIGINATPPLMRQVGYAAPATEVMAQDDLLVETPAGRHEMDSTVHVYFDQPRDLIFGALVPKGPFTTVSLLGRRLDRSSINQFLRIPEVALVVGEEPPLTCGCRPRVAVGAARQYYDDRFIAVGDSCVTRLYKDGIGSAFVTAEKAAHVAIEQGIGRRAFESQYAPLCNSIARDNRYGRIVFKVVALLKGRSILMRGLGRLLISERVRDADQRPIGQILWALLTGDSDYCEILKMMLMPKSIALFGVAVIQERFARFRPHKGATTKDADAFGDAAERSG